MKLLEGCIEGNLPDLRFGSGFLHVTPKAQTTEERDKLDFTKITNFCASKDTIKRVKRQPTGWEKILASNVTNKRLISKIYKQLIQLNIKKQTTQFKKWAKYLNRHFSREDK